MMSRGRKGEVGGVIGEGAASPSSPVRGVWGSAVSSPDPWQKQIFVQFLTSISGGYDVCP